MVQALDRTNSKETGQYVERFAQLERPAGEPGWLAPLRQAGINSFAALGFPTLHHEDWRYTNVAPIARLPFKMIENGEAQSGMEEGLQGAPFSGLNGFRLVFVNGKFHPGLSRQPAPPKGAVITSLAAAVAEGSPRLEPYLGKCAQIDNNAFAALNQAFFRDGAFIHVPAGVEVSEPVQLVFLSTGAASSATIQPRNLVVAESNSRLTVVESYLHMAGSQYVTNAVTELSVADNAHVEWVKFQDEAPDAYHVATIQGQFGRTSHVKVHSFALGAKLSRNNIRTSLSGEGLECILNGLYLTRGEQLADHHMIVEHAQPHCSSHEYFNGILDDKSKGVFHGRILVRQVAQKTDAKQTNKNLLLSDEATADTKPQLEIYADDVKCTHGATIGQLSDESIFYLRSRGISVETARRMLIHAFAGEIIERISCAAVREELDKLVWDRLEANPHLAEPGAR